jgi:RHS repeat-associated protein
VADGAVAVDGVVDAVNTEEQAHPASPVYLAAHPADGSVWVAIGTTVFQLDSHGVVKTSLTTSKAVVALTADRVGQRVWVAAGTTLSAYNTTAQVTSTIYLGSGNPALAASSDAGSGDLWVVVSSEVRRYSGTGQLAAHTALASAAAGGLIAADGQGTAWLAVGSDLYHLDAQGAVEGASIPTAADTTSIRALAADPTDGSLWVARKVQVHHVDSAGDVMVALKLWNDIELTALALWDDHTPPTLSLALDANQGSSKRPSMTASYSDVGTGVDAATLTFKRGGQPLAVTCTPVTGGQSCTPTSELPDGASTITATVADLRGNVSAEATVTVTVVVQQTNPPPPVSGDKVVASAGSAGVSTISGSAGAAQPDATVTATNTRTGQQASAVAGADGSFTVSVGGQVGDLVKVVETTANGDSLPVTVRVMQPGIAAGALDMRRWATLRGVVRTRDGANLPGVTVSVQGAPQFGQAVTNTGGVYELTANGGATLTLNLRKAGYLPAQRQASTPWRDYVQVDDTVLVAPDVATTTIDLSGATSTMQVHQGGVATDLDGSRRATVLIPAGTSAQMVLPGGGTQPLTSATVRATEYTIGSDPAVMPAKLPPASAYTYAVEYSADEAIAAGAKTVQFSQPVIHYSENFLSFPTGGQVPVGYYDRDKVTWVPSDDGRVLGILSITSGRADLDVDGSGLAATPAQLTALGITDDERASLAGLYPISQTLWRVQIPHFTSWDCNWPETCAGTGACEAPASDPPRDDPADDCKSSGAGGSIIRCQKQVLGETRPVVGTPFRLYYTSERVPGRLAEATLNIPLTGATVPPGLSRIDVTVNVAGQVTRSTHGVGPNATATYQWDGKDANGNTINGELPAAIRVGYVYPAVYGKPPAENKTFGVASSTGLNANRQSMEITSYRDSLRQVRRFDDRVKGLGGWSLDVHHAFDINGQRLLLGNGISVALSTRHLGALGATPVIHVEGGNADISAFPPFDPAVWDNEPAQQTRLFNAANVAVAPDGSIYYNAIAAGCFHTDPQCNRRGTRIRRIDPAGIVRSFAGTGYCCFSGDGGPASNAMIDSVYDMDVGPDGSLYLLANKRVRKIDPSGIITTVAGNGSFGSYQFGGAAIQSPLDFPLTVAAGPDGSVYISGNETIAKVMPDGTLTRFAGQQGVCATRWTDGIPARDALLGCSIWSVRTGQDGTVYFADAANFLIRKVSPTGIVSTIGGNGDYCNPRPTPSGYGGPATATCIQDPTQIAVARDGTIFIGRNNQPDQIERITPEGILTLIAGNGQDDPLLEGQPALAAGVGEQQGLATRADGALIFPADYDQIGSLQLPVPGYSASNFSVPSPDGREIYTFDPQGRHLTTLDALTNALRHRFHYDSSARLTSVEDQNGLITSIERDASGNPTGIVAPNGQRTSLTVDGNGYLASISNPAGETTQLTQGADGLLTKLTTPKIQDYTFTYDPLGRLQTDSNPAGGGWTLTRDSNTGNYQVNMTTALGRTRHHQVVYPTASGPTYANTNSAGLVTKTAIGTDGTDQTTFPDGTIRTAMRSADPRFGMQAPFVSHVDTRLPSGLTRTIDTTRTQAIDSSGAVPRLVSQADAITVNGRAGTWSYDAGTGTVTTTSPVGRQSVAHLDAQGRLSQLDRAGLESVAYSYDSRGRVSLVTVGSGTAARTLTPSYDSQDRLSTMTDPLNRIFGFSYDLANRVATQRLPGPDGERDVSLSYDLDGNLQSLTPPGESAYTFGYNPVDLETSYTTPTVAGVASSTTNTAQNADKQVSSITRPDGDVITPGYDAAGRLSSLTFPDVLNRPAMLTGTWAYDPTTGRLTSATSPYGGSIAYSYDGALLLSSTWAGPVAGSVSWTYDNDFRPASETAGGTAVSFGYDPDSLLTSAGSLTLTRHPQHGAVTATGLGVVSDSRTFSTFGELSTYAATYNDGTARHFDISYTRDKLGRITSKTETIQGTTTTVDYDYDAAGRLHTVTTNGSVTATYVYDTNGNRGAGTSATYDAQDRLVSTSTATYTYADAGELLTKTTSTGTTTNSYDAAGNLLRVVPPSGPTIDYVIDARSRRVGKKVGGIRVQAFLYRDRLKPVVELDGAGNVVSRFVYGTSRFTPDYMVKAGVTYRILSDHLGSVRLVVNTATGAVAQRMDFDEWGNVTADTMPGFQPFGFAGGLYDRDTGLVRFGARDYDPATGRWTAKDSARFRGGLNFYSYCRNNPISLIDPRGRAPGQIYSDYPSAARDAAKDIGQRAREGGDVEIDQNGYLPPNSGAGAEWACVICRVAEGWTYTEPTTLGKRGSSESRTGEAVCRAAGGVPISDEHNHFNSPEPTNPDDYDDNIEQGTYGHIVLDGEIASSYGHDGYNYEPGFVNFGEGF